MDSEIITNETIRSLFLVLYISAPVLISVTIVGFIVGLFQALTSIQEQTLPHSFKFLVAILAIIISASWATELLSQYTHNIYHLIPRL